MALIECNECGAQVSDKASKCPKCGNPLKAGKERTKQIINKTIGIFCLLAAIATATLEIFNVRYLFRFDIEGIDHDKYYTINDYTNAYVDYGGHTTELVLIMIVVVALLWIAQIKLLPRIKSLYVPLFTAIFLSICCYIQYNREKTKEEKELALEQYRQKIAMSYPDFKQKEAEAPKVEAGKELLSKELKGCYSFDIEHLIGMTDTVAINYCNALNEFAIKTWNRPLNGLGVNIYQAAYYNDYGRKVTDKFYVFFKDEKPIKYAKENIIKECSSGDLLFLMLHNFE